MSPAFRAALAAFLQASGSVSTTPRAITSLRLITSQYQPPSPLGIIRSSTFPVLVMVLLSVLGVDQDTPASPSLLCLKTFTRSRSPSLNNPPIVVPRFP